MKKIFYSLLAVALFTTGISCSSDSDDNSTDLTPNQVSSVISTGTWRITNYSEETEDHTSDYTGYNFTFADAGTISATNGTNTYSGAWTVEDDNSNDDSVSDVDFNIIFGAPANFAELSEDWDIVGKTNTKLILRHLSGGDGSIDYLVFEKN